MKYTQKKSQPHTIQIQKIISLFLFIINQISSMFSGNIENELNKTLSLSGDTFVGLEAAEGHSIAVTNPLSGTPASIIYHENLAGGSSTLNSTETITCITSDYQQKNIYMGTRSGKILKANFANPAQINVITYTTESTANIKIIKGGEEGEVAVVREGINKIEIYLASGLNTNTNHWSIEKKFRPKVVIEGVEETSPSLTIFDITKFRNTENRFIYVHVHKPTTNNYTCSYDMEGVEIFDSNYEPLFCEDNGIDPIMIRITNSELLTRMRFYSGKHNQEIIDPRNGELLYTFEYPYHVYNFFVMRNADLQILYIEDKVNVDSFVFFERYNTPPASYCHHFLDSIKQRYFKKHSVYDYTQEKLIIAGLTTTSTIGLETWKRNASQCTDPNCSYCDATYPEICYFCKNGALKNYSSIPEIGTCQSTCPINTIRQSEQCLSGCINSFGFNTISQKCERCKEFQCKRCQSNPEICETCIVGYTLNPITGKCNACNSNQFNLKRLGLCKNCDISCSTCDISAKNCTSCPQGTFLENGSCLVICPDGEYRLESNNTCQSCHESCSTCASFESCSTCPEKKCLSEETGRCSESACPFVDTIDYKENSVLTWKISRRDFSDFTRYKVEFSEGNIQYHESLKLENPKEILKVIFFLIKKG